MSLFPTNITHYPVCFELPKIASLFFLTFPSSPCQKRQLLCHSIRQSCISIEQIFCLVINKSRHNTMETSKEREVHGPQDMDHGKDVTTVPTPSPPTRHGIQFWVVIMSLSALSFISALDVMIIATALPSITESIGGATEYIWIANSFVIASAVLQPMIGQVGTDRNFRLPLLRMTSREEKKG